MRLQNWTLIFCLGIVFGVSPNAMPAESLRNGLSIYLVDVEGGGATLVVTPAGESVLIDAGWRTTEKRDSKRILATMKKAGLSYLDYLIVSHYHSDHLGGVVELAKQIEVKHFLDRGPMTSVPPYVSQELYSDYMAVAKDRRRAVRPGEKLALKAEAGGPVTTIEILSANGETISAEQGQKNAECTGAKPAEEDTGENANSIAMLLKFGSFKYFDGADLTWEKEGQLVCPVNQIGAVNVYQVDHHGKATSNNPDLIASLQPQAAIVNNGPNKGGDPAVFTTLRKYLSEKDIYQLHRNARSDAGSNGATKNQANPSAADDGFGFELNVRRDGSAYGILNERTHQTRTYKTNRDH